MSVFDLLIAAAAAVLAGAVNALAGGGTLISFPALIALGVPPVAANITNAVALCPGYFGATLAQARSLRGRRRQLLVLIPVACMGGLLGAFILINTGERTFTRLVPWMILAASLLLAIQEPVRRWVMQRLTTSQRHRTLALTALTIAVASIYGGFFSAGMSVLLLAVLGLTLDDSLTHLNALKQVLSFCVNIAAVSVFLWSGQVIWSAAAVMAVGALLGGALGGRLAGRLSPAVLRWTVVTGGVIIALIYWIRG